jgi:site-specific DNA recombinase
VHQVCTCDRVYVKMADVTAIVYVRQSVDRTGEELGITRQREDCLARAQQRGWQVTETISDNDTSASGKVRRPGFEKLITLIEAGGVTAVIAWDMTRLARNTRDHMRLIQACCDAGTVIAPVQGPDMDLSSADGRIIAVMLGQLAQHEIERKSDRQKRAALQRAEAGLPGPGRRPFGYEPDRATVREVEAAALRRAYDDVLVGVPLARIAEALNAQGLFTAQTTRAGEPSPWSAQTLRPTLTNPRYAGICARTIRPEHGRPTWDIVGPAAWQAIVPEVTWRAVNAILTDPSRRNPPGSARALLTGLGMCGVCGVASGVYVHGGRTRDGRRTYRCSATMGHISRQADPVDEYVSAVIVARLSRPDAVSLLDRGGHPDVGALHSKAVALRARLDQFAMELADTDSDLDDRQIRTASKRTRERLAEVEKELADAGRVNVLAPLVLADDVQAAWDAMDVDRQRAVIDVLISVVVLPPGRGTRTFRPETVEITWKVG